MPTSEQFFSAFLTFVIITGGAVGTLFMGEGVNTFADIPQVQYGGVFMLGLVAAAKDLQSRKAAP